MRLSQILKASGFVQLLASWVLAFHQLRVGQQFDGLRLCQSVFQTWRGHVQQQRFFAGLEVQQCIS